MSLDLAVCYICWLELLECDITLDIELVEEWNTVDFGTLLLFLLMCSIYSMKVFTFKSLLSFSLPSEQIVAVFQKQWTEIAATLNSR